MNLEIASPPAKRPREVKLPEPEGSQYNQRNQSSYIGRVRMPIDEGGGSDREAEEPKLAAGYYWIKHINGDTDLTEAEKQKANNYNLTELITRVAYKRPVVKKKRRNPEEYWQQKDEDLLHENCITAREIFEYLHQFSPKKIIHKTLAEQDRMIQMLENANGRPVYMKFWEERHNEHRMHCWTCGMVDDHWTLCCPRKGQLDKDTDLTQRGKDSQSEGAALDAGHSEIADEMKE